MDTLVAQVTAVLAGWNMPVDLARTTAEVMVDADLAGIDSHGISMLPIYETQLRDGRLHVHGRPAVTREGPVTAVVDAGGGLGHPAAVESMRLATDKAAQAGVGLVAVRRSRHFGAAGYYAALAAQRGMIGLVTTSARTVCVPPARGAVPRLATNPLAFAAPAGRNRPFLLDMSTSTIAVNKVKVFGYQDRRLPAGWVLDGGGNSVRDAREAMLHIRGERPGGLTPLGGTPEMSGHKGYGLGMMVQILSAILSGADDEPDAVGHFLMAVDPGAFRDKGAFEADLDEMIDLMHDTPALDPELPVLVPGDPEAAARERRLREGISLPDALVDQLRGVCERAGVQFLLGE
jgi:LDH2 family malate/lactate/ureidoglycolate dehydrogenase